MADGGRGRRRHRPDPRPGGLHPRKQPGGPLPGSGKAHRPSTGADVSGKTLESAQTAFAKVGLYLRPSGSGGSYSSSSTVAVGQSITAGPWWTRAPVVDVQFIDTDIQDYANNTGIR